MASPIYCPQHKLLEEYIQTLERQNTAKNIERQAIYEQLNRLKHQLNSMEQLLAVLKFRSDQNQVTKLKQQIKGLQEEVMILKYQQQQIFQQNLSLIVSLEEANIKIMESERQNKDINIQKEQVEKFRSSLERITKTLEDLELERTALTQASIALSEQNIYLKSILECQPKLKIPHPSPCSQNNQLLNFKLSSSLEKISEYEQEYEQSMEHENSKICQSNDKKGSQSSSNQKLGFCEKREEICIKDQTPYLVSYQNSNDGFRNHQNQCPKTNEISLLNLQTAQSINQLHSFQRQTTPLKNNDQSSCDVIQQSYDQSSHYLPNPHQQNQVLSYQNSCIQSCISQLQEQLINVQQKLIRSQTQKNYLQTKIYEKEKAEQQNITEVQIKIQELLKNYEAIVKYVEKLEIQNQQYKQKIQQLEIFKKQAQQYIQQQHQNIERLQQSKFQSQYSKNKSEDPDELSKNDLSYQTEKGFLIKQNNKLMQKLAEVQKQKILLFQQINSSQDSFKTIQKFFKETDKFDSKSDKENSMIQCNQKQENRNLNSSLSYLQKPNKLMNSKSQKKTFLKRRNSQTSRQSVPKFLISKNRTNLSKTEIMEKIEYVKQQNMELLKGFDYC